MHGKRTGNKFTIQFSRDDAAHLQVTDILNRQKRYGKAQYIVDAVIHYVNFGLTEASRRPMRLDEKHIEVVVSRILNGMDIGGAGTVPVPTHTASSPAGRDDGQPQYDTDVVYDDAMEALGEEGLGAIAGALDMFRKK